MASYIQPDEAENYFRLMCLLLDCGTSVLRKLLVTHSLSNHADLDQHLAHNKIILEDLKNKHILHPGQMDLLFPSCGTAADISLFDITLLSCVLLNTCPLPLQKQQNIRQLRTLRNDLSGHYPQAAISKADFVTNWAKISSVILAIARSVNDQVFEDSVSDNIVRLKIDPHFSRPSMEVIRKWFDNSYELMQKMDLHENKRETRHTDLATKVTQVFTRQNETFHETKTIKLNIEDQVRKLDVLEENQEKMIDKMQLWEQRSVGLQADINSLKKTIMVHKTGMKEAAEEAQKIELPSQEVKASNLRQTPGQRLENPSLEVKIRQTRCFLDNVNCIQTTHFRTAEKILRDTSSVVLTGNAGEGKTAVACGLIRQLATNHCVKLTSAKDWNDVDPESIHVIFVDDIFGLHTLDDERLNQWLPVLDNIQACVSLKRLKVIFTSRSDILNHCLSFLERYKMFQNKVELSTPALLEDERVCMLQNCLDHTNKGNILNAEGVKLCVESFDSPIGFPYCCKMFVEDERLLQKKNEFFARPVEFFRQNIFAMEKEKVAALACLFFKGGVLSLSCKESASILPQIGNHVELDKGVSMEKIRSSLKEMTGSFVNRKQGEFTFAHRLVDEAVGLRCGGMDIVKTIEICTIDFFCSCIRLGTLTRTQDLLIVTPKRSIYKALARRMIKEIVEEKKVQEIAFHPLLKNTDIVRTLFQILQKEKLELQFLRSRDELSTDMFLFRSLGMRHYLSYCPVVPLLMSVSSDAIIPMVTQCLQFLKCKHGPITDESAKKCWKCRQKQAAIHVACRHANTVLGEVLVRSGISVTPSCIKFAVASKCEYFLVSFVIPALRKESKWDYRSEDFTEAMETAHELGEKTMIDALEAEGVPVLEGCLLAAVKSRSIDIVEKTIRRLKDKRFDWMSSKCSIAMQTAHELGETAIVQMLKKSGIAVTMDCVVPAIKSNCLGMVKDTIRVLNNTNALILTHEHLEIAYKQGIVAICEFIENLGVDITSRCIFEVIWHERPELLRETIRKLQQSGKWDQDDRYTRLSLESSYCLNNETMINMLESAGVVTTSVCLHDCIRGDNPDINMVIHAIEKLKMNGQWDPQKKYIRKALNETLKESEFKDRHTEIYELLYEELTGERCAVM